MEHAKQACSSERLICNSFGRQASCRGPVTDRPTRHLTERPFSWRGAKIKPLSACSVVAGTGGNSRSLCLSDFVQYIRLGDFMSCSVRCWRQEGRFHMQCSTQVHTCFYQWCYCRLNWVGGDGSSFESLALAVKGGAKSDMTALFFLLAVHVDFWEWKCHVSAQRPWRDCQHAAPSLGQREFLCRIWCQGAALEPGLEMHLQDRTKVASWILQGTDREAWGQVFL